MLYSESYIFNLNIFKLWLWGWFYLLSIMMLSAFMCFIIFYCEHMFAQTLLRKFFKVWIAIICHEDTAFARFLGLLPNLIHL